MMDFEALAIQLEKGTKLAIETVVDIISNSLSEKNKLEACRVLLNKVLPDLQLIGKRDLDKPNLEAIKMKLTDTIKQLESNQKIKDAGEVKEGEIVDITSK